MHGVWKNQNKKKWEVQEDGLNEYNKKRQRIKPDDIYNYLIKKKRFFDKKRIRSGNKRTITAKPKRDSTN